LRFPVRDPALRCRARESGIAILRLARQLRTADSRIIRFRGMRRFPFLPRWLHWRRFSRADIDAAALGHSGTTQSARDAQVGERRCQKNPSCDGAGA